MLLSFDTREHLDALARLAERQRLLDEIDPYIEGERTLNVVGGFAGWFGRPGMAKVKTWKQAAIVLLAIIPISLLVTARAALAAAGRQLVDGRPDRQRGRRGAAVVGGDAVPHPRVRALAATMTTSQTRR